MIQLAELPGTEKRQAPLRLAEQLFVRLHRSGVRYCHWKSNQSLPEALTGVGDLDLLVDPEGTQAFQASIAELGFKQFAQPAWQAQPSVVHYYGHDVATGQLLHLHIYYRLVTGGHLLKNYRLPLERMLLQHSHMEHGVMVADQAAELAVFVLRKMLEAGDWIELLLQRLDNAHLQRELHWLLPGEPQHRDALMNETRRLLADHLPQLDWALWCEGVAMLLVPGPMLRQYALGRRFRYRLRGVALRGRVVATTITLGRMARVLMNRLLGRRSKKWPAHGGSVVALVGPEASGKSTYSNAVCKWLASAMVTRTAHLGKPSASLPSRLANIARPLFHRKCQATTGPAANLAQRSLSWPYAIASVLLARDRYRLASRAYCAAARGMVVVCDRYPSQHSGAVDGPRLGASSDRAEGSWFVKWAARIEQSYYQRIPPADIVLQLAVPVAVAQLRNRQRVKIGKEDDAYLARRHQQFHAGRSQRSARNIVDTTAPMEKVLTELRELVWKRL